MRPAWLVLDLGFGDAGKGATIDHLARREGADWVIRHHGGAQAGHNVVTPDGRHHTFSQLGAGTFVPGVRTLLADAFVLHPGALRFELAHLAECGVPDALERLFVDARARVITPVHQAALHLQELARGPQAHGTTGVGIDPCVRDALADHDDAVCARELGVVSALSRKIRSQQERWRAALSDLRGLADPRAASAWALLDDPDLADQAIALWSPLHALQRVDPGEGDRHIQHARQPLFEGAQGVLLDEVWGFHPHVTWGDCTTHSARRLAGDRELRVLALTRTSTCRHGAGPLPGEMPAPEGVHEPHNDAEGWQGRFRFGALDLVLLRYAARVAGGIDGVGLNHCDHVREPWPIVVAYRVDGRLVTELEAGEEADLGAREGLARQLGRSEPEVRYVGMKELRERVEEAVGKPIVIEGWGPGSGHRSGGRDDRGER